jgi:hypothetical protein
MEDKNKTQAIELSDILQKGIDSYMEGHTLVPVQQKAVDSIISCRTSKLGGHSKTCNNCGFVKQAYNSCRNRHCPKCQFVKQEQWVDKLAHNLLPCKYYHVVFTVPKELHTTLYLNQKKCYTLLFKAASQALLKAAANPEHLGAQAGALAILHTWTQTLCFHPHIHMLVPAGGLSEDGVEWVRTSKKFFLPQKVLASIFRGILVRLIKEGLEKGEIKLPENIEKFDTLKTGAYKKDWNVYIKKPFRGVNSVLKYLARYTHRVAISNSRFVEFTGEHVTFRYTDNKDKGKRKIMKLETNEFIRRYLQHILPANFYKIRYIGILANINSKAKKEQCLSIIGIQNYLPQLEGLTAIETMGIFKLEDMLLCPECKKGKMCLLPKESG